MSLLVYSLLVQAEGKRQPFFEGCKKGDDIMIWAYPQEYLRVVIRDEKVWIECGEKYGLSILRTQLIDSENSSIIWLVWPNGWVFVYELSGSGFESSCSHLNFSFRTCFEQGVPWHSGSDRVWNHAENVYVTWQEHTVKKFLLLWNLK